MTCEQVAHVRMCTEWEKGGRGGACAPLKTMAMYVAFQARLIGGTEGYLASSDLLEGDITVVD